MCSEGQSGGRETLASHECEPLLRDAAWRDAAYRVLAALLVRAPTAELLELMAQGEGWPGELGESWRSFLAAGRALGCDALDEEYHRLFIGLGGGELQPYGSWYRTGRLLDKPLAALRRDLAALGIERQPEVREPEDHAAALCEAMALLIGTAAGLEAEKAFYCAHLEPWMGRFFRDLQAAQSALFYRGVGRFGEFFVESEGRYLRASA